jgi:hypothetical protein
MSVLDILLNGDAGHGPGQFQLVFVHVMPGYKKRGDYNKSPEQEAGREYKADKIYLAHVRLQFINFPST